MAHLHWIEPGRIIIRPRNAPAIRQPQERAGTCRGRDQEDEESFERGRVLRLLRSESSAVDLEAEPLEEVQSVPPSEATADPDEDEDDSAESEREEPDEVALLSDGDDEDDE